MDHPPPATTSYQNDFWFKDVIKQGIYPQPSAMSVSPASMSATSPKPPPSPSSMAATIGQTYNLVGPDILTGARTAQIWSAALGKPVSYAGHSVTWTNGNARPPRCSRPHGLSTSASCTEFIQKSGLKATPADFDRPNPTPRPPPRKFEDFVKEAKVAF